MLACLLATTPVWATPPAHAPAHGWRKKNDATYAGYTGHAWSRDYGVTTGRCSTEAVLAAAGGVVGGVIGSQVGDGSGRVIATVIGAAIGTVIGSQIGRELESTDRGCIGQSLELAPVGQTVRWSSNGQAFLLVPTGDAGGGCRRFTLAIDGGKPVPATGCAAGDGNWKLTAAPADASDKGNGHGADKSGGNDKGKDKDNDKGKSKDKHAS